MKSSFATLVEEIGREADRRDAMRSPFNSIDFLPPDAALPERFLDLLVSDHRPLS